MDFTEEQFCSISFRIVQKYQALFQNDNRRARFRYARTSAQFHIETVKRECANESRTIGTRSAVWKAERIAPLKFDNGGFMKNFRKFLVIGAGIALATSIPRLRTPS